MKYYNSRTRCFPPERLPVKRAILIDNLLMSARLKEILKQHGINTLEELENNYPEILNRVKGKQKEELVKYMAV